MDSIDPVWQLSGIALIIGFLLGTVIQMLLKRSSGDIDKLKAEMEKTRAEMEQYKASVNRHFNKTSDLVNELTQDYVKVYQHLAEGAQSLSDTPVFAQMLEQSQGRVLISVEDDSVDAGEKGEGVADPAIEPIDGSSKAAAAERAEAASVEAETIEVTGPDSLNTVEAEKKATEMTTDDTATDADRRDPVVDDLPKQADADTAIKPEADTDTAAKTDADAAKKV